MSQQLPMKSKKKKRRRNATTAMMDIGAATTASTVSGGVGQHSDTTTTANLVPWKLSEINFQVSEVCKRKYELNIGSTSQLPLCNTMNPSYTRILGSTMWGEWMWGCNPAEECAIDVLLNRCHMIGLLLARYRGATMPSEKRRASDILLDPPQPPTEETSKTKTTTTAKFLCLLPGPIGEYSLRDLRDAIQNLQLYWCGSKDALQTPAVEVQGIDEMVDACFRRFGELANGAGWPSEVMNDQGSIEDGTNGGTWLGALPTRGLHMNRICLRRFLNVFLVMYRHIYMQRMAVNVEGDDTGGITVNVHHAVAGGDDFDNLSMCWDLMPSARLNYMHDFHGMYNCVSQVVYFHNSKYERRKHMREDFEGLVRGKYEPVHILSCLLQLYPDIEVLYEEDNFSPIPGKIKNKAAWVMAGKRLYLLVKGRGLLYNPNPVVALASHLNSE